MGEMIKMGGNNSRKITYNELLDHDACSPYRHRFMERFADGVELTVDLAVSQAADWDWHWAGGNLLKDCDGFFEAYDTADHVMGTALRPYQELFDAAYQKIKTKADETRCDALNNGMSEYAAWDLYDKIITDGTTVEYAAKEAAYEALHKIFQETIAREFAERYIAEKPEDQPGWCSFCNTPHDYWED